MKSRVEGYFADESSMRGGKGQDDQWLADLRQESRRAMIRRLVMDRVRTGGFGDGPRPVPLDSTADGVPYGAMDDVSATPRGSWRPDWPKVCEAAVVGVVVTLAGTWLCARLGLARRS